VSADFVCNPDFNVSQLGVVTRWTPVKNLTFSAEVQWFHLDQKLQGTARWRVGSHLAFTDRLKEGEQLLAEADRRMYIQKQEHHKILKALNTVADVRRPGTVRDAVAG
jgi:hypothetical protein